MFSTTSFDKLETSYGPFSKGMRRVCMIFTFIFMKFIFTMCFGPDTFVQESLKIQKNSQMQYLRIHPCSSNKVQSTHTDVYTIVTPLVFPPSPINSSIVHCNEGQAYYVKGMMIRILDPTLYTRTRYT